MMGDCGLRSADGGLSRRGTLRARPSAFRPVTRNAAKSAFTLVELLVVIAIIAILSSMLLGAASLSMGTARQSRTEALVTRLHTLLSQHYDSFRTRRVEVADTAVTNVGASGDPRTALARTRLAATREQLKMELPDRWSDLLGQTLGGDTAAAPSANAALAPRYLETMPSMTRMYLRRYERIRTIQNKVTGAPNTAADLRQNQGAECLYLIIMLAAGDGESAGLFKENEIGDTDGDGAPEFLDAWGNPIEFLRWAPGFDSDIQLDMTELTTITDDDVRARVVAADRDPFDLFRVDRYDPSASGTAGMPRGFRLAPLIYSAGADQEFGIWTAPPWVNVASDPYASDSGNYLGATIDRGAATDNVHNHYIKGR